MNSESEWTPMRVETYAAALLLMERYDAASAPLEQEMDRIAAGGAGRAAVAELYDIVVRTGTSHTQREIIRRLLVFVTVLECTTLDSRDIAALGQALIPGGGSESDWMKRCSSPEEILNQTRTNRHARRGGQSRSPLARL